MSRIDRKTMLNLIERNIERSGFHVYVLKGGILPRYVYTIGLSESIGSELIFPGATWFSLNEVLEIVRSVRAELEAKGVDCVTDESRELGLFQVRRVHETWVSELMLGATDYYGRSNVSALQIAPKCESRSIDVPDMSRCWSADREPVWRWIKEPWPFEVAEDTSIVTNTRALAGDRITEMTRWEGDEWEMFAGSVDDVERNEMQVAPLASFLAYDPTLEVALELEVGSGVWRDESSDEWRPMGSGK